ncbi:hypothetical protein [Fodinicurvata sp. EGI_FJ10296]|uniref:hypothetical protein n=1 Tax=Fodinicurvata sp. EGI_FJ10296 TaxID=3231908 RepID=UPI0034558278
MVDRVTCPILGPPGIVVSTIDYRATPASGPGPGPGPAPGPLVVERADDPEAFRILIAPHGGLAAILDDKPVTVETGSVLLANPGRRLEPRAAIHEAGRTLAGTAGRLFILPDTVVRRLVNSLTTGKGGLVRFVESRIEDIALAAMMADIHEILMREPTNRRGEALFVGALASLLRQHGQIGGIPAASPLKSAPVASRVASRVDTHAESPVAGPREPAAVH